VVSQTLSAFEYIVIDGASTDDSTSILKDYESRINYWVSEPDNGIYHAMNKGLKIAKGDVVFFLNSGDIFYDENVITKLLKTFNSDDDLVYGDVLLKHERNNWERLQVHPETLPFSYFYKGTICQQACFFKKSLFD
jgi:glycosyltransferase involved in cell wall biosynthesis